MHSEDETKQLTPFLAVMNIIDNSYKQIKEINEHVAELYKQIKEKEKDKNEYEKIIALNYKKLSKIHQDELIKCVKSKTHKKKNVKGGFNNEIPIPEKLCLFLGLDNNTLMSRPKVMKLLNSKFDELGLKKGHITTLNKDVVSQLGLSNEYINKEIKFTEFQSFLAKFYANN